MNFVELTYKLSPEMSYCPKCGSEVDNSDQFCRACGRELTEMTTSTVARQPPEPESTGEPVPVNTSGQGKMGQVPPEIRGWNWGAFLLSWVWGIGHEVWLSLLAFVPVAGLAVPFVLGARGSEWAWQRRRWDSTTHFLESQRKWAVAGVLWWSAVALAIASIAYFTVGEVTRYAEGEIECARIADDGTIFDDESELLSVSCESDDAKVELVGWAQKKRGCVHRFGADFAYENVEGDWICARTIQKSEAGAAKVGEEAYLPFRAPG